MSKKKVLHLAKWYPNKAKPLLGIFIGKHIQSVQQSFDNKVNIVSKPIQLSQNSTDSKSL
jgi:hypothetical protein